MRIMARASIIGLLTLVRPLLLASFTVLNRSNSGSLHGGTFCCSDVRAVLITDTLRVLYFSTTYWTFFTHLRKTLAQWRHTVHLSRDRHDNPPVDHGICVVELAVSVVTVAYGTRCRGASATPNPTPSRTGAVCTLRTVAFDRRSSSVICCIGSCWHSGAGGSWLARVNLVAAPPNAVDTAGHSPVSVCGHHRHHGHHGHHMWWCHRSCKVFETACRECLCGEARLRAVSYLGHLTLAVLATALAVTGVDGGCASRHLRWQQRRGPSRCHRWADRVGALI